MTRWHEPERESWTSALIQYAAFLLTVLMLLAILLGATSVEPR